MASKEFDDMIFGRVMILVSLGTKTNLKLYASLGKSVQKLPKYQSVHKNHPNHIRNKKIQKLTFSDGWITKFRKRHRLVRRAGDKQKTGKLPPDEVVSANQLRIQAKMEAAHIHPLLKAASGKNNFWKCIQYCLFVWPWIKRENGIV